MVLAGFLCLCCGLKLAPAALPGYLPAYACCVVLASDLVGDRHVSMLQALAATTRSVLSGTDTSKDVTAREVLTASAPAIQNAITQGVYGSGQGRATIMEHQVATMQS